MKSLKKGETIQIQRRGYFICDQEYAPYSVCVGRARPVLLIAIPDGTPGSYGPPGKAAQGKQAEAASKMASKGGKTEAKGTKADKKTVKESPKKASTPINGSSGDTLNASIGSQGDLVRKLKTEKAAKSEIDEAVKKLLALKAEYKAATGSDWKPGAGPTPAPVAPSSDSGALNSDIANQGD